MLMGDFISILIADDNLDFSTILNEYLTQCGDMTVKGVAKDGIEAVAMIRDLQPDIVILDLIMPGLDGIGVLEKVSNMQLRNRPIFIIVSAIGKDIFVQKAMELGAEYYIMKPFDINLLVLRIRQLYREKSENQNTILNYRRNNPTDSRMEGDQREQIIAGFIKSMGITPNISGYRYLREAVILSMEDPSITTNTDMNRIYIKIASRHNTAARNVDRAIRCAIDNACKNIRNTGKDNLNLTVHFNGKLRLNNVQVITLLAEKARLTMAASE